MSTHSRQPRLPADYRLQVDGHLDQHWSAWFGDLTLIRHDDGTTTLTGPIADQSELHGIIARIRDLGVTLVSLAIVDPPDNATTQLEAP